MRPSVTTESGSAVESMAWIRDRPVGLVRHDPDASCEGYTLY
jgi:hypothetical protein